MVAYESDRSQRLLTRKLLGGHLRRFDCIFSHPTRDFSIVHNSKLHSLYMKPSWFIATNVQNCSVSVS